MSIVKFILGLILVGLIPGHWFLAGVALGTPAFILWAVLGVAGIWLIISSFTSQ
jgi:hypothetical protein